MFRISSQFKELTQWGFAASWWLRGPHQYTWTGDSLLAPRGRQGQVQGWNGAGMSKPCSTAVGFHSLPGRHQSQFGRLQTSFSCFRPVQPVEHTGVWMCLGECVCWVWKMKKYYLWWLWLSFTLIPLLLMLVYPHTQQPSSQLVLSNMEATWGSRNLNVSELELNGIYFFYFILENSCVSFRCTAKWFSYTYSYTYSFSDYFPIRSLQSIECSSLCYTVGPY